MNFVASNCVFYLASIIAVMYTVLCYTGSRYNGTWLYMANVMCCMRGAEECITIWHSKCCEISQDLDGHFEWRHLFEKSCTESLKSWETLNKELFFTSTVQADGLALLSDSSSACTVMTKLEFGASTWWPILKYAYGIFRMKIPYAHIRWVKLFILVRTLYDLRVWICWCGHVIN